MKTVIRALVGVGGVTVPLVGPEGLDLPHLHVQDYASYCGAGTGIGDLIVPDTMWGLPISPACYIHDEMWAMSDGSWIHFHLSNSIFLHNLISLIDSQSRSKILKRLRIYRAATYYSAVDTFGKTVYWDVTKLNGILGVGQIP